MGFNPITVLFAFILAISSIIFIIFSATSKRLPSTCLAGDASIMSKKAYGTSNIPIQENLRWNEDEGVASSICNHNRHWAEPSGYFTENPDFMNQIRAFEQEQKEDLLLNETITYYDSNTGIALFEAPIGRTWEEFIDESIAHGWYVFITCCKCLKLMNISSGHHFEMRKSNGIMFAV